MHEGTFYTQQQGYAFHISLPVVFAVGGRENDIALYDIEQKDAIFRGRNVPNDFLNLRVPIWVADMQVASLSSLEA